MKHLTSVIVTLMLYSPSAYAADIVQSTAKFDDTSLQVLKKNLDTKDFYGSSIATIGDLDQDGVIDIAVGAHGDEGYNLQSGAIYIHFLSADATVKHSVKIDDKTKNGPGELGLSTDDSYGTAIENIGDINGDGIQDIAVGAFWDEGSMQDSGAVYIHFF